MINKICKTTGFKLPHTSTSPVLTKQTKEVQPEINRNFPRLENRMPEGEGKYNAALNSNHHDFDPRNREIYESMPQHVKDSLHSEANKYGKSFWSDQHQVNVDPEDGVLSNRPRDAKGEYFKYETINKPYSNAAPQQTVSSSGGDNTIDYSNMTPEQKSSLADFWKSEIEAYGGIEPGSEGYAELVGANSYAVYDDYAKGRRGENIKLDAPRWRFKSQGPEYDNPSGIHPNQLMRMYQGDDNVYE
tara:strand:+ start:44 stop:778 length:735 start_codon:yes stop_codon:yes gene_type:complete